VPQPAVPLEATDAGREPAPGILHARLLRELLPHALPGMRDGPAQDGQAGRRKPALLPPAEPLRKRSSEMAGKVRFRGATPITIHRFYGPQNRHQSRPTPHRTLRSWSWHSDDLEYELRDAAGTLLARIESNAGRHRLTHPRTWPILSWPDMAETKHRAESVALSAIALDAVDPKLAARLKRDNGTPHPMGPPLNRSCLQRGAS